jgi:hypothetical protein
MYRREALARTPIRSVMSFALRAHQRTLGALNFFAEDPHAFNASAQDVGFAYATHAALAWDALRRDAQFREALRSRDVISQAKGMLMERYHIDATEAFVRLREQSQISNVPLVDIARSVTEEHNA